MTSPTDLADIRRTFAARVMTAAGCSNERVERAFASVPRENFVGPGPWKMLRGGEYVATPDDNPLHLYDDVPVALIPERRLNNGQPSLHAALLSAAEPRPGAHIVHVGAGAGFFSAIMAELTGLKGSVTAIEYESELADRAKENLRPWSNVEVVHADGTAHTPPNADLIYVNAGATRPADAWLDALSEGGCLVLPLTAPVATTATPAMPQGWTGAIFLIKRRADEYFVTKILPTIIFPCAGGRDDASEAALSAAFKSGGIHRVKRLYRHGDEREAICWLRTPSWSLAYH